MVDFVVVVICLLAWGGCFYLLAHTRCQHLHISLGGMRCADCGMSIRKIAVARTLGLDTRKVQFVDTAECQFEPVFPYIRTRLVEEPPTSPRMYREVEELTPDAPPHIVELFEAMMLRRYGLSYLWKSKHV